MAYKSNVYYQATSKIVMSRGPTLASDSKDLLTDLKEAASSHNACHCVLVQVCRYDQLSLAPEKAATIQSFTCR